MEYRTRIAAMIIRDGKLLMLQGKDKAGIVRPELWTPGGKIELGETDEDCLRRELQEEIGVQFVSARFFGEYQSKSHYRDYGMTRSKVYIVNVEGKITPDNEIVAYFWLSHSDFKNKKYPMIPVTEEEIIPDLIKQGIWK
jgi:8-oxo-dGTP diphosphatase